MLRRSWILLATLAAGITFGIGTAGAIEFGQPDNERHPWVGLVVFFDAQGAPIQRCTGSLLSPEQSAPDGRRLLLTAGHCAGPEASAGTPQPSSARIWFDEGPIDFDPAYKGGSCAVGGPYNGFPCAGEDAFGVPVAHPGWVEAGGVLTQPQTNDVGVVVLDPKSAHLPDTYGVLAPVGYLNQLAGKRGQQDTSFEVVGYGIQSVKLPPVAVRLVGDVQLTSLGSAKIDPWGVQFSGSPGKGSGSGAICYGDSGGPVLHQSVEGQVIVAVSSYVKSKNCTGPGVGYRVDTQYARDFVADPAKG
jgi:hypothetical protein